MTERLIRRWALTCLTYRKTILLAVAAVTIVTASALPRARFDNALEGWFLDDDPSLVAHQRLVDTFGSDELIIVGIEAPDVFAPDVLAAIDGLTHAIAAAPHVEKVFSLTNMESVTGRDDVLEVRDLVEFPLDPSTLPLIRAKALSGRLYVGNVVSASGDFACIIARIPHHSDDFAYKVEAVEGVRDVMATIALPPGVRLYMSGGPPLDERFFVLSEQDTTRIVPMMLVFLTLALWMLLRSPTGVLVPLTTVSIATVWSVGAIVLAGARINVVTTMLPPLLLAVGVADSMHFLVDYQSRCARDTAKREALLEVYDELMVPLFLTSLTTAIGLLSLAISRVQGIREFGIFAAIGVASAFLLSVTLVPIVLSYAPVPRVRTGRSADRIVSAATLGRIHDFTVDHGQAIAIGSALLVLLGIAGASRVRAESVFLEIFRDGEPIKLETKRIEQALAGTLTLDVMVDTGRDDGIKDPGVLRTIEKLQAHLEADPEVSSSQSITDYFKEMRRAMFAGANDEYRLPETREEAAQYLLLYEMDAPTGDIKEYATFDYRQTRVSARMSMSSSNAATALVERTEAWLHANLPPELSTTVTGMVTLYAEMEEYIRGSLVRGFTIALIAIFFVFCVQLRSVALGAIAMIPNIAPIVLGLGIMGFTGIRLDSMTAMVASIAIGLAVDDSIHFVSRVRLHQQRGSTVRVALRDSTVEIGRAIVYTSLVLCGGFGVMLIANFVGMVYFGALCLVTIVFALVADLLLMPVLLRWYGERQPRATVAQPLPASPAAGSRAGD